MKAISELLRTYPELALFATLSLGYFLGQFKYGRISLGTVASTLLVGVVIGLAEVKISPFTKSIFFYLFIFAIGYKVGPQFFRGLRGEGLQHALLAMIFCVLALATVWAISRVMRYDKGLAAGLMAGALTSSGAIGSARDAINQLNAAPEVKSKAVTHLAVAYSVTYLFGSAGIAWFLSQVAPRILGIDLREECARRERELSGGKGEQQAGMSEGLGQFISRAFRVRGANGGGHSVAELERGGGGFFSGERVRHGTAVLDAEPGTEIAEGDVVAVVGRREAVLGAGALIGEEVLDNDLLQFPLQ